MFKILNTAAAALISAALFAPGLANADCKLLQLAEFHLDPHSTAPIVDGTVNGTPVKVLLDTGSDFSMITYHEAKKLGLRLSESTGIRAYGIGGSTQIYTADVGKLTVGDLAKSNFAVTVSGVEDRPSSVALVLGYDVLSNADLEFDFAHNTVRMFKPKGCTAPQLVYWGAAYSQAVLLPRRRDNPSLETKAELNGRQVLATLDSGAETTLVDAGVAAAAGVVRADSPKPGTVIGSGPLAEESWIGRFDSFAFGDEKIAHVGVLISHVMQDQTFTTIDSKMIRHIEGPSMFIGDDFLRAHRVFVDNEDNLILFSYQGGPVFDVAVGATTLEPSPQ
jgi:predicted aspartyl protease